MRLANKRIDELTKALEKTQASADKAAAKLDKADKATDKLSKTLSNAKAGLVAGAATVTGMAIAVDRAADRLIRYSGVMDNAAFAIDKARKSTRGLVTDYDLQRLANQAAQLEVAKTAERYAELTGAVTKLGHAQGRDAVDSIERMISALGRGETETLDELGVRLKVTDAYREYAQMLGKATSELTDHEKARAVAVVGAEEIIARAKELNATTNEQAEAIKRASVEWQNFGDTALVLAGKGMGTFRKSTQEAFEWLGLAGGNAVELNENLTLGEQNAATMAIAMQRVRAEIEAAALAADPMIAAFEAGVAMVDDHLQKYDDSLKLISLSERATERAQRLVEKQRREARRAAKEAHKERLEQLQEEFKQLVINANQGAAYARASISGRRSRGTEENELRLAQGEFGTLQPSEARFENMQRTRPGDRVAQERQKNDELLAERMRALEAEREAGVDPMMQIEREQAARLEHNEFMRENAQSEIERMQLVDERRQILHEGHLRRIKAEKAAEKKKLDDMITWSRVSTQLLSDSASIAMTIGESTIRNEERRARFMNRMRGIQVIGGALQEVFEAAASAARYDIPGAVLHAAAAAVGFVNGGMLLANNVGGGRGAGGRGGITGANFGGGGGLGGSGFGGSAANDGVGGGRRSEGLADQINSDVPPSPNPNSPTTATQSSSQQQGGFVNNGVIHLYGTPKADFIDAVTRGQELRARNQRRFG